MPLALTNQRPDQGPDKRARVRVFAPGDILSARRPNFQTKGDHTQHTPHVRLRNNVRFVSVYFMIMKLNLFMACNE